MLTLCVAAPDAAHVAERVVPVGVWACLLYGDKVRGDERATLVLTSLSATYIATQIPGGVTPWRRLGDWETRRGELTFVDARTGRIYSADLERPTLGGTWGSRGREGGWWCARRDEDPVSVPLDIRTSPREFHVPALIPDVMASPQYPRRAVQQAREGTAVVCFLVDPSGAVYDPVIVEISDEIFAATTLWAITRSHYRPSASAESPRPGCRSYTYTLEAIRD